MKKHDTQQFVQINPILANVHIQIQKVQQRGLSPGGSVTKTLHSQCRGTRFNPWLGKTRFPHATTKSFHAVTRDPECYK